MLAKSVPARAMRCRYLQSHDEGEEEREPPQQQEDVQNLRAKRERELLVQYFCWRDNVIRREFQFALPHTARPAFPVDFLVFEGNTGVSLFECLYQLRVA
ncbi:hypothetical protein Y032_1153g3703 [Ancylostoma ceylanicum]|uniref:Uncharacterized protein n=1 Tax=Ancylostoma ceylanicum TaxID=53326 RepID=A0A016W647_9BILA|nr:hypothetical protein Y032_1153g3703 [Ancylostoma ceylanicum]